MPRLAIIRHGHTAWNRAGRLQGRTDIPLDDHARGELAGQRLPESWASADLYASPLLRAQQTAELIGDRKARSAEALMEMDWGRFEGQISKELRGDPNSGFRDIEHWACDYRSHGGESPAMLWTRLEPWLTSLFRDSIAVCHIGTMRVILAKAHGWDFDGPAPFQVKRNRLYTFDIAADGTLQQTGITRLEKRAL